MEHRTSSTRVAFGALAVTLALFALSLSPVESSAQDTEGVSPDRSGFTMLLSLGIGRQEDLALPEAETGLAGLNLGIGGFLQNDLALWFRVSGTTADYGSFQQTSAVAGPALQWWVNDRLNLEGGIGAGVWSIDESSDTGAGLMLGAGYVFFNTGGHNLQVGVEYAGAFTDPETVHNLGLTFGWQLL